MKMSNDKVVGFYKKVLGNIRDAISTERSQVKRYIWHIYLNKNKKEKVDFIY